MPKHRILTTNQPVTILYEKNVGYVQKPAIFKEYRSIQINNTPHDVPVFKCEDKELTGLETFWVFPEEAKDEQSIRKLQFDIIGVQIRALQIAQDMEIEMPNKLNDPAIEKAAKENAIKTLGYDPQDQSWLETELAVTDKEKNWFKFEREKNVAFYQLMYVNDWEAIVRLYNDEFQDDLSVMNAKVTSIKRMRYIFGATPLRESGNKDVSKWKAAARAFEERHRKVDERMQQWSVDHQGKFPIVKTKKELGFNPGPYFNQCVEKIPQYFTTPECKIIKEGSLLRVVSYDPKEQFIKLDFPAEVRYKIKPDEQQEMPWINSGADYFISILPSQVSETLEFIGKDENGFQDGAGRN